MNKKRCGWVCILTFSLLMAGCVGLLLGNFGSGNLQMDKDKFSKNYETIKTIIAEECNNNGFKELKQEVKLIFYSC